MSNKKLNDIFGGMKIPAKVTFGKERADLYGDKAVVAVDTYGGEGVFLDVEGILNPVHLYLDLNDAEKLHELLGRAIAYQRKVVNDGAVGKKNEVQQYNAPTFGGIDI